MFAVIKTGGKQYKVAKNDVLKIEKLEATVGSVVLFDDVLAFTDDAGKATLGSPIVKDVKVSAEILEQKKADKVMIFKKKRRQNYRRKKGHRQLITVVKIQDIGKGLQAKAAAPKAEENKAESAPKAAKKAAPKAKKSAKTEKAE